MARRLGWCDICGAWITDEDANRGPGLGGEPLCGACRAWAGIEMAAHLLETWTAGRAACPRPLRSGALEAMVVAERLTSEPPPQRMTIDYTDWRSVQYRIDAPPVRDGGTLSLAHSIPAHGVPPPAPGQTLAEASVGGLLAGLYQSLCRAFGQGPANGEAA